MIRTILAVMMLCPVLAWAEAPSTQCTTAPAHDTSDASDTNATQSTLHVAYFDLGNRILEKPDDFSLLGEGENQTLREILAAMLKAKCDPNVKAVLLTMDDPAMNLSQALEIRDVLVQITQSGKPTFAYADQYEMTAYVAATGAQHICMLEGGQLMMPGVNLEAMFARGLLDKIGVKADYIQVGEYKGADEQFTRTQPSDELKGELNKLVDGLYHQLISEIATHRKLSREKTAQLMDRGLFNGRAALDDGLVDHLTDIDGLRELIAKELSAKIDLLHHYGQKEREEIDFSNPFEVLGLLMRKPQTSNKPSIALVYADGVITDGDGGEGLLGEGIGSSRFRKAMRLASRDRNVKAVVLRIDSPGGSAVASEAMWQSVRRVAKSKPVIVSIGGMAASGGYYLASAGQTIYADPTAIVGSIGVVGGKFVVHDLFEKIGLNTAAFSRGQNAGLFSSSKPFTEQQRQQVNQWMKQTYDLFTQRVMTTRANKIKDIDQVARGRIFLAKQAKELGMVDELGGLDAAMTDAAKRVNLKPGEYEVRILPAPRTLADLLLGEDPQTAMPIRPRLSLDGGSMLMALSPALRQAVGRQLQVLMLLQEHPVMLVCPVVMTVR
ncbi:MAG: signal peptide peptidase SppA [Phycisphaerales bacterium]|nr:signal peptide peptidase SppA [Phycisphaerales bacterium]